jgi:hypothetical protein
MSLGDPGAVVGVTSHQARKAALFLCGRARSRADAVLLLEACGLLPYQPGPPVKARAEQEAVIKHPVRGQ